MYNSALSTEDRWESIRKEARKLENEMDQRLLQYSRMSNTTFLRSAAQQQPASSSDGSSTGNDVLQQINDAANEIEALLKKYQDLTGQMGQMVNESASSEMLHTVQRHRDILHDYKQEFKRTKSNINASLTRAQLLQSAEKDIRYTRLQSDKDTIINADRLTSNLISQAQEVRSNLDAQGSSFRNITGTMASMRGMFPFIDTVIGNIQQRKKRDMIILAVVIILCVLFTAWLIS